MDEIHAATVTSDETPNKGRGPTDRFPMPLPDGRTELRSTPLQLIERLAALVPPLPIHHQRDHGADAFNINPATQM